MCSWLLYDNPVKSEEDRLHTCRHTQLITVLPRWYVAAYGAPRKHIGEGDKSLFWGYSSTANGIWGLAQIIGGQCPPPLLPLSRPHTSRVVKLQVRPGILSESLTRNVPRGLLWDLSTISTSFLIIRPWNHSNDCRPLYGATYVLGM